MQIARAVPPLRRLLEERDAARADHDAAVARLREVKTRLRRQREHAGKLKSRLERARVELVEERKKSAFYLRGIERLQGELAVHRQSPPITGEESYDYVFVMAFQRSGSTLLQVLLNSIPGYLIRGENGGLLADLHRFHRRAQKQKELRRGHAADVGFPFFGINEFDEQASLDQIRELVTRTLLRPLPDSRVLGFKEVNWYVDDLQDYVEFYREVFPNARFIINTRRIEDSAKSRWFAQRDDSVEFLTGEQAKLMTVLEQLGPDIAFHQRYDDYVEDHGQLKELFDWLGAPFDRDRIDELMAHTYA